MPNLKKNIIHTNCFESELLVVHGKRCGDQIEIKMVFGACILSENVDLLYKLYITNLILYHKFNNFYISFEKEL